MSTNGHFLAVMGFMGTLKLFYGFTKFGLRVGSGGSGTFPNFWRFQNVNPMTFLTPPHPVGHSSPLCALPTGNVQRGQGGKEVLSSIGAL